MAKIPSILGDSRVNRITKNLEKMKKRLYIVTHGCIPMYRRLGIGSAMLRHILESIPCYEDSICSVFLHVQINNEEAIAFYKRFGFEIVETVTNYYCRLEPPDAYVMEKKLISTM